MDRLYPLFDFTRPTAQMNLFFKLRTLDIKGKAGRTVGTKQVVILAGLHAVSRDFSDEFLCSSGLIVHKISVKPKLTSLLIHTGYFNKIYSI